MKADSVEARVVIWVRKKVIPTVVYLIAVASCFYMGRLLTTDRIARAQGEPRPFVLETELYSFVHDPAGVLAQRRTIARRSDGSSVSVDSFGLLSLGITARKVTYIDGRSVTIVDDFRMKSTWPAVPPEQLGFFKSHVLRTPRNCVEAEDEAWVGSRMAYGVQVMIVKHEPAENSPSPDRYRITHSRAPELGCKALTYLVEVKQDDGSWVPRTEQRVVSLKLEEPDAQLFGDGSGYTEAKPSEIERMLFEREGIPVDEATWSQKAEQDDKGYLKK